MYEADQIALANDLVDAVAQARAELGYVDFLRGRYDRAELWLADALKFAGGSASIKAKAMTYLGAVESDRANYRRATGLLEQAVTLAQAAGEPRRRAYGLSMLGRVNLFRGALDIAAEQFDASIKLAERDHWLAFLPWPEALRGEVQLARADAAVLAVYGLVGRAARRLARFWQLGDRAAGRQAVEDLRRAARHLLDAAVVDTWVLVDNLAHVVEDAVAVSPWRLLRRTAHWNGLWERYLRALAIGDHPVVQVWPSQRAVLDKGLLDRDDASMTVSMPTSAGKTHIAEWAILHALAEPAGGPLPRLAVYVVPSRALAGEVERHLAASLGSTGLRVSGLFGGSEHVEYGLQPDQQPPVPQHAAQPGRHARPVGLLLRLLGLHLGEQEPRRLLDPPPQVEHGQAGDGPEREHDPPDVVVAEAGAQQPDGDQQRDDKARALRGKHQGDHVAAVALGRVLAHDRRADRVVPADAEAEQPAQRDQPPDAGRERGRDRADGEHEHLVAVDPPAAERLRRLHRHPRRPRREPLDSTHPRRRLNHARNPSHTATQE